MNSHKILAAIVVAGSGVVANDAEALPTDMTSYTVNETLNCDGGCTGTISLVGTITVDTSAPTELDLWDFSFVLTRSDGGDAVTLIGPSFMSGSVLSVVATDTTLTISPSEEGVSFYNIPDDDFSSRFFQIGDYDNAQDDTNLSVMVNDAWSAQLDRGTQTSISFDAVSSAVPLPGALPLAIGGMAALGGMAAARRRS